MKKLYFLFLGLLLLFYPILAEVKVTIEIQEPGESEELFAAHQDATDVILKGRINHVDLTLLRAYCRSVKTIDLSDVTIEAYSDDINYIDYPEGELTMALQDTKTLESIILPRSIRSIASKALYRCPVLTTIVLPSPQIPKLASRTTYFVEGARMKTVRLYVLHSLLEQYRNHPYSGWKFTNIEGIVLDHWADMEWDNVYGDNMYPIGKDAPRKVFMAAYVTNNTNETIDDVTFEYCYDGGQPKEVSLHNVQLLPGATIPDGQGFLYFDAPEDNYPHLLSIKPIKVNGTPTKKEARYRPIQVYHIEDTYREPSHLVECIIDPNDEECMKRYHNVVHCIARLEGITGKPNRHELITIVGSTTDTQFSSDGVGQDLVDSYQIPSASRLMFNRALMTPYGTLNNDKELAGISPYTPAVKMSSDILNMYEYLFQRSFYKPGFAEMTGTLTCDEQGYFRVVYTGKLCAGERLTADHRLSVFVVENTPMPLFDKESEDVIIPQGTIYRRLLRRLSPKEGYPIRVDTDRNFTIELDPFAIDDYISGKLRLVAVVHREGEAQPCADGVLQSYGLPISDENIVSREHKISLTTKLSAGELSFGIKTYNQTPISIDWGDGIDIAYTMDSAYKEFSNEVKGPHIVIKGDLTMLNCMASKITEIDLSKAPNLEVLQAALNFIEEIDLSHCPKLIAAELFQCSFKTLDFSHNPYLSRVVISENYLDSIDLSHCPELDYFDCSRMKRISSLDLSSNHKLKHLVANECALTELRLAVDAPLEELLCEGNDLTELNLQSFHGLKTLSCKDNSNLTQVILDSEILESVNCMNCSLSTLNLLPSAQTMSYLMVGGNTKLDGIDLSHFSKLTSLGLSDCNFSELNLENMTLLENLWAKGNQISELDARNCPLLTYLNAGQNNLKRILLPTQGKLETLLLPQNALSDLDLSRATVLKVLDLGMGNHIAHLDLSACKALQVLNVRGNPIKDLKIDQLSALNKLGLEDCGLSGIELNNIYRQLPKLAKMPSSVNLFNGAKDDIGAKTSNTNIAKERNWRPKVDGDGSAAIEIPMREDNRLIVQVKDSGHLLVHSPIQRGVLKLYNMCGELIGLFPINAPETIVSTAGTLQQGTYIAVLLEENSGCSYHHRLLIP